MKTVLEKTKAQPGSGRDAFSAFSQGEGNVLLTYENEAIKAEKEGEEVEYVIPPSTIQIETPIAVTKEAPEPAAEDFLKFLWSNEGQEIWAENGYRPVNPKLVDPKQFPTPKKLFKISQVRRLGQGQRRILRRRIRLGGQDRGRTRSLHLRLIDGGPRRKSESPRPGQASACPGSAPASAAGMVVLYLSLIVLLPMAALTEPIAEPGPRPLLEPGHLTTGDALARADPRLLADRRR